MIEDFETIRARALARKVAQADLPAFDRFWLEYPRPVGKLLTKAKFDAITSENGLDTKMLDRTTGEYMRVHLQATEDQLIEAARAYKRTQLDRNGSLIDGGKWCLHPATFLNTGRFLDFL